MRLFLLVCFCLLSAAAFAQTPPQTPRAFSLAEAMNFAVANLDNLKNLKLDKDLAAQKERELRAKLYPQANGNIDLRWNAVRPTNILPGTIAGLPADEKIPVKFGTNFSLAPTLEATYSIYEPTLRPSIRSQHLNQELAEKTLARNEFETRVTVKKAYYAVLLNRMRVRLAQQNLKRSEAFLAEAKVKLENQRLIKLEVDRLTLAAANRKAELDRAQQQLEQSKIVLKYQMGLDLEAAIIVSDSLLLENETGDLPSLADTASAQTNRIEFSVLKLQVEQEKFNLQKNRRAYLPSVSLYSSFSAQAFRNKFDFYDFSQPWYGVAYLGIRVNVPIFDGFQKDAAIKQSRINLQKKDFEQKTLERNVRYQFQNAYQNMLNARHNLEIQRNNRKLADEVLRGAKDRFDEGLGFGKDVIDAEIGIDDAQANYFIAMYDFVSARSDWELALGAVK